MNQVAVRAVDFRISFIISKLLLPRWQFSSIQFVCYGVLHGIIHHKHKHARHFQVEPLSTNRNAAECWYSQRNSKHTRLKCVTHMLVWPLPVGVCWLKNVSSSFITHPPVFPPSHLDFSTKPSCVSALCWHVGASCQVDVEWARAGTLGPWASFYSLSICFTTRDTASTGSSPSWLAEATIPDLVATALPLVALCAATFPPRAIR